MFDFHNEPIKIVFAGVTFYDCQNLIVVNERPILSVQPSIEDGAPVRLSGVFCDSHGRETLIISENEWSVDSGNWDVECEGPRIVIRSAPRRIALVLRMNSPQGIIIERIDMFFEGVQFKGDENILKFSVDGKNWEKWTGCSMSHCNVGIAINTWPVAANDAVYQS